MDDDGIWGLVPHLVGRPDDRDEGGRRCGKDAVEYAVMDHSQFGAGIVQDVLQRRSLQGRIDGDINRAEIVDREHDPQRQRAGGQYQHDMIALANAELAEIAGQTFDSAQGLREGPALAAFERREHIVRPVAGVALQRVTQHADFSRISALGHIGGRKR